MGRNTDKIRNIPKNKKQLIGLILIGVIAIISIVAIGVITNGDKVIEAESETSISAENTTSKQPTDDKMACGIKIKFIYEDKYWEKYDLTNAVFKTQDEYEDAVCNYMDEIAKLLNKQDWYKQITDKDTLYIKLVIEGKSYYEQSKLRLEEYDDTMPLVNVMTASTLADYTANAYLYTIVLNSAMFDHGFVPIVHQLTDLITYNKVTNSSKSLVSSSLKTGLGEYTQSYFGMGIASCNHSLDIHNYVIEHEKICEKDPTLNSSSKEKGLFWTGITNRAIVSSASESSSIKSSSVGSLSDVEFPTIITPSLDSQNFGVECCSSFVDYLVQTYGLENVMKMVDAYDDSIYYLYNQNGVEGLISDWQKFLADYPCKMTWDEIDAYVTAFKNTHGY